MHATYVFTRESTIAVLKLIKNLSTHKQTTAYIIMGAMYCSYFQIKIPLPHFIMLAALIVNSLHQQLLPITRNCCFRTCGNATRRLECSTCGQLWMTSLYSQHSGSNTPGFTNNTCSTSHYRSCRKSRTTCLKTSVITYRSAKWSIQSSIWLPCELVLTINGEWL